MALCAGGKGKCTVSCLLSCLLKILSHTGQVFLKICIFLNISVCRIKAAINTARYSEFCLSTFQYMTPFHRVFCLIQSQVTNTSLIGLAPVPPGTIPTINWGNHSLCPIKINLVYLNKLLKDSHVLFNLNCSRKRLDCC